MTESRHIRARNFGELTCRAGDCPSACPFNRKQEGNMHEDSSMSERYTVGDLELARKECPRPSRELQKEQVTFRYDRIGRLIAWSRCLIPRTDPRSEIGTTAAPARRYRYLMQRLSQDPPQVFHVHDLRPPLSLVQNGSHRHRAGDFFQHILILTGYGLHQSTRS